MGDEGKVLDIKTADLKATAPIFRSQSEAVGLALSALRTSLAEAGAAWGDDSPGRKFNEKYGPIVERIENSAGIIKEGLASIHAAMSDMADGHIDNDVLIGAIFGKGAPEGNEGAGDPGRQR